ncbi:conserved hypothetical protein [Tenacibaculum litopenaei]|uniref:hypothetical protein n=1 Tax=Tenacibaculum litopenaei TaxID=396016 RepID=UPI003894F8BE
MKKLILLFITMAFMSCNNDVENLKIKGTVKGAVTKEVLKGIEITIICWKYGSSPDESYSEDETITVKTNEQGVYEYTFDKGAYIEVKVSNPAYIDIHETKEVFSKKNKIDLFLDKK